MLSVNNWRTMRSRAGTQGRAHSNFALARNGARKQKIRDIGAGDQQNETDGREKNQQREAYVADHLFLKRNDSEGEAAVGRIGFRIIAAQASGDCVHLRLSCGERDARLELANDIEILVFADARSVWPERQRKEHVRAIGAVERGKNFSGQRKCLRKNSDDFVGDAVEQD